MSEPMRAGMRQLQRERGRRLAEALSELSPTAPEAAVPEDPEDAAVGLRLLCMHRVAPQSWFNTAMCIMVYRDDDIPEEDYATHILNPNDATHVEILERQKVTRCGLHDFAFPEHFYWRYFDEKSKLQKYGFTEDQLRSQCIGIELYLMYLQAAGLIRIYNDVMEADPHQRGYTVRLIQAAVVRGYKKAQNHVIERINEGKVSGFKVRHGTHALTAAAILEAGGPKGSRNADEHEFTTPGLYTCPDGELSPLSYATHARIVMYHEHHMPQNLDLWAQPCAQFVFRGDELLEGARTKKVKSFGTDQQWIYLEDHHVNWTELQVWIGVPLHQRAEIGLFTCAPCFDGSRRCTRLIKTGAWNAEGLKYTKYKGTTSSSKMADPFPVISSSMSPANTLPEGWEAGDE